MSKYKFSLSPKARKQAEWALESYHEDLRQLERYKLDLMPSGTANYNFTGGGRSSEPGTPTENIAIKFLTSAYILNTERCIKAVDRVLEYCDDTDKKMIELVYWSKTYTIEGAGRRANLSRSAAYYRINDILCAVALEMGLVSV